MFRKLLCWLHIHKIPEKLDHKIIRCEECNKPVFKLT